MAEEEVHRILRSVGLFDRRNVESDLLSTGQEGSRDRRSAEREPELLILDERRRDGAGGDGAVHPPDPETFRESGVTILFCEHDIALVFEIANRIMVMVRGATVVQGSGEEVRRNREVQSAYLGESG